jgi:hypothetical protein
MKRCTSVFYFIFDINKTRKMEQNNNTQEKDLMQLIEEKKFDEILSKYYLC